jgi:hypothetical protein
LDLVRLQLIRTDTGRLRRFGSLDKILRLCDKPSRTAPFLGGVEPVVNDKIFILLEAGLCVIDSLPYPAWIDHKDWLKTVPLPVIGEVL